MLFWGGGREPHAERTASANALTWKHAGSVRLMGSGRGEHHGSEETAKDEVMATMAFHSPASTAWTLAFIPREMGTMKGLEQRSSKEAQLLIDGGGGAGWRGVGTDTSVRRLLRECNQKMVVACTRTGGHNERPLDSGCVLKVRLTGFPDVGFEREKGKPW